MKEFREVIQKVSRGAKLAKSLTREEARQALKWIFNGQASEFQIGAFFAAMRMKGESSEETAGWVDAVREQAVQLHTHLEDILDIGEPYDGKLHSLHITLPTALILSAAGVPVVLHGASETPVKKGVETQGILEALGVKTFNDTRGEVTLPLLQQIFEKEKIIFLPTEKLAPDYARLRPLRESFGLRPFANHIEKIFNLANAGTQIVGVYHRPYLEPMGDALKLLGLGRAFVIQGVEGFSELYLSRKTLVLEVEKGGASSSWLDPGQFALLGEEELLVQKTAPAHAERILEILKGAKGQGRESILWNAGVKLYWMKKTESVKTGIQMARKILDGEALKKLESFRNATQEKTHSQTV